jgi:hypothetical protein
MVAKVVQVMLDLRADLVGSVMAWTPRRCVTAVKAFHASLVRKAVVRELVALQHSKTRPLSRKHTDRFPNRVAAVNDDHDERPIGYHPSISPRGGALAD